MKVLGMHHISSTVGHAQRNVDFMSGLLGLRLVKHTLNYDDKNLFHFYFGNNDGSTGLATTFPLTDSIEGIVGGGQVTRSIYAVPKGSIKFWSERLASFGIDYEVIDNFGRSALNFTDLDGLELQLLETDFENLNPYITNDINKDHAFIGIHSAQLLSMKPDKTLEVLRDVLGYEMVEERANMTLLKAHDNLGGEIELSMQKLPMGRMGKGTVHHIAFSVENGSMEAWRTHLIEKGYKPTEVKNRNYFQSLYFREPGGILIELATQGPGVLIDESLETLGQSFIIPKHYEKDREEIMNAMMPIFVRNITTFMEYGYRDKYEYDLLQNKKMLKEKIMTLINLSKTRDLSDEETNKYKDLRLEYLNNGRNIK